MLLHSTAQPMRFDQGGAASQIHIGWQGPLEVIYSYVLLKATQVIQGLVLSSLGFLQGGQNCKRKPKYCTRKKKKHTSMMKNILII